MNHDQLRDETLRLVNLARVAMGKSELDDLPLGVRSDCKHCPLANALEADEVGLTCILLGSKEDKVAKAWSIHEDGLFCIYPPIALRQFISAFDRGEFPEYETEPEYES